MIKKVKKEQLLMVALAGILLLVIAIPVPKEKEHAIEEKTAEKVEEERVTLEEQLQNILQKIAGVGRVEVLITYEDQGRMIVEKDESISEELIQETDSSGGTRTTTTKRNENVLFHFYLFKVFHPCYYTCITWHSPVTSW